MSEWDLQWSAMSKVLSPASAYRNIASTAASRSIRPQPPLVCHIPLSTRHIASESSPFFNTATRGAFSSVAAVFTHRTAIGRRRGRDLAAGVEVRRRRGWSEEADILFLGGDKISRPSPLPRLRWCQWFCFGSREAHTCSPRDSMKMPTHLFVIF